MRTTLAVLITLLALDTDARANRPEHHTRDFLVGVALALGSANLSSEVSSLGGFSLGIDLELGVAVARDSALHLELSATIANSEPASSASSIGLGVIHYFMPVNGYVSGTFLLGRACVGTDNEVCSDLGMGVGLEGGVQFWVDAERGVGPALQFRYLDLDGTAFFGLHLAVNFTWF